MSFSPVMASEGGRSLFLCNGEHPQKPTPVQLQLANLLGELLQSLLQVRRCERLGANPLLVVPTPQMGWEHACMLPLAQSLLRKT